MKKHLILTLIISLLTGITFISQASIKSNKLSSIDGLSNSAISVIHKDSSGILWIGTWDGLNSYDGKNIRVFKSDKKNTKSLTSNVIVNIVEPEKGTLWVSTTHGVNRLNIKTREINRYFEKEGKNASTSLKSYKLALGPENLIFCFTLGQQLTYYNKIKNEFIPLSIEQLKSKRITQILNDEKGTLFILTSDSKLYRLQIKIVNKVPEIESFMQILNQYLINNIYRKTDNEFWILDKNQKYIYIYNSNTNLFKVVAEIDGLPVRGGIQTINSFNNEIIVGLPTTGLFYFDLLLKKWIRFDNPDYHGGVLSSYYDKQQQILWVGTNNNGLIANYREQLNFKLISKKELSNNHGSAIRAICEDVNGKIWIGSRGNGLSVISKVNDPAIKVHNLPEFINKSVLSITKGPDGLMIVGTESEGLFSCNPTNLKVSKIDLTPISEFNDVTNPPIYALYWDETQSSLWIGTNTVGIFQIKCKIQTKKFIFEEFYAYNKENKSGLTNNNNYSILPCNDNSVWVSTRGAGVFLINSLTHQTELIINEESNSPLSDNDVLCLAKSSDGSFWAGTSYGLNRISYLNEKVEVKQYTEQNGLPNNTVHGILEDESGIIWISTNNGLSRINPKTDQITNYNHGYGLQSNEFSDGAYTKTSKGELFFGGVNGLNHFYASEFEEREYVPKVVITDIKLNNENVAPALLTKTDHKGAYISLNYNQNFFSVLFVAIDYINNGNCEYRYILEGFNKEWVNQGTTNSATFTNVTPGEYLLKIRSTNGDKVWNNEMKVLRIKVAKPWWKSWLAFTLYIVTIGLFFYLIISMIIKRIQLNRSLFEERMAKKEQVVTYEAKMRFFTNIAHEFCTPITLIYGPCEKLLENEQTEVSSKKYLQIIKNNAERMQRLINDLMDFRRAESDNKKIIFEEVDMHELTKYISDSFVEFSEQRFISFNLLFSNNNRIFVTDRDAMEKIFFNLISNAYKYTDEQGKISVSIDIDESQLILKVKNTGPGIKKGELQNVFNRFQILDNFERNAGLGQIQRTGIGLALTKSLVTLLKGEIKVDSCENEFTEFQIEIPTPKNVEIKSSVLTTPILPINNCSTLKTSGEKYQIFIIDDEIEIRNLLKDILSPFYEIIEAADGNEGLDQLKHHRPDLIICDVIMPNMSGTAFLDEIKINRITSHIPVIFLSSKATIEDQIANFQRGLEFFISKPFNTKFLLSVVNQIINSRGTLKEYFNSPLSSIEEFNGNFIHTDEKKFLFSIAEIIKKNMENEQLGAEFICRQLNITRILLYRRIKELANTTPTEFIREVRLKEAERLIRSTKLTIQEIMYQTGFNNKSYFYTIFRTAYDFSPSEYRKKNFFIE
jgi:signal transduction histidine kinase/ligand-binding sensor domain-containing protein/CheY-like chemotaxis protein/AraC-like DNA-binding protein